MRRILGGIGLSLVIGMFVAALASKSSYGGGEPIAAAEPNDGVAVGRELSTAVMGFGCASQDSLRRLRELSGDKTAALLFVASSESGCRQIDAHTPLVIEATDDAMVKARPVGDPRSLWIYRYTFSPER